MFSQTFENSSKNPLTAIAAQGMMWVRGVEQLAARRAHNPKVAGSSPASATNSASARKASSGRFLLRADSLFLRAGAPRPQEFSALFAAASRNVETACPA
jgi:hypothetical protein